MQKLVWQNANGVELDLTSGNYGITEWEGFSNASLNIQSQQVPFQDGGVFLDALIEQRELTITLAMQDNNNLELRYQQRRELISALNPKLGEGYLIYTNDYTSKRIKCIPQIPLFETHNSDKAGTPKASLSWTACNPYWEDLKETVVNISEGYVKNINNQGDVPAQVKINFFAGSVQNPTIENKTNNKKIQYKATLEGNLLIDTNKGHKSVVLQNEYATDTLRTKPTIYGMCFVENLLKYISVGDYAILTSYDGKEWETQYSETSTRFTDVISAKGKIIAVGDDGVIVTSNDGINWTSQTSGTSQTLEKIKYFSDTDIFIIVGRNGTILTSTDCISWTARTSGTSETISSVTYSSNLEKYVAVGGNGLVLISNDGVGWVDYSISTDSTIRDIVYSETLEMFMAGGTNGLYVTSTDGFNWVFYSITNTIERIFYAQKYGCYVMVTRANSVFGNVQISRDGTHWASVVNTDQDLFAIAGTECILVGGDYGYVLGSLDCENWEVFSEYGTFGLIRGIAYSEELDLYVGVTPICLIRSKDLVNWEVDNTKHSSNIIYVEALHCFIFASNGIYKSEDGINWVSCGTFAENFKSIYYDESTGTVIAGSVSGGNIYFSTDLKLWETVNTGLYYGINGIVYSEELKLYVAISSLGIKTTNNLYSAWTTQEYSGTTNLTDIGYSSKLRLFIAVGTGAIITSSDGIVWNTQTVTEGINLEKVFVSKTTENIFVISSSIRLSYDGINWVQIFKGNKILDDIIQNEEQNCFISVGSAETIRKTYLQGSENVIENLSSESDMNFNLEVGQNGIGLNKAIGTFSAMLTFRQKYIGV